MFVVLHAVMCDACQKENFSGFRYRCQKCPHYTLCQDCFWRGRVSPPHALDHQVKEYSTFVSTVFYPNFDCKVINVGFIFCFSRQVRPLVILYVSPFDVFLKSRKITYPDFLINLRKHLISLILCK